MKNPCDHHDYNLPDEPCTCHQYQVKPVKPKPQFYSVCLEPLQQIAKEFGYNLLIHGSMNRDMDIVAVPWVDEPKSHMELIHAFCDYFGVEKYSNKEAYLYTILPGGRTNFVINLNRGGKYNGYVDAQYYLDISITPTSLPNSK